MVEQFEKVSSAWYHGDESSNIRYDLWSNTYEAQYLIICSYYGEVGNIWSFDTITEAHRMLEQFVGL